MLTIHPLPNRQETAILIHGLLRTHRSMWQLARTLRRAGYQVHLYRYPSSRETIQQHSQKLQQFFLLNLPNDSKQYHIITHSLGGIIARDALYHLPAIKRRQFGKFIMLAPPSQGSPVATWLNNYLPTCTRWIKPLRQLTQDKAAAIHQVPIPTDMTIGIIAADFDRKAPAELTRISVSHDFMRVRSGHAFIMNQRQTKQAVLNFLSYGCFKQHQ